MLNISKNEMKSVLAEIMKEKTVAAPASNGKKLDFLNIASVDEIVMNDEIPYKSPKEYFFPRCEKIITFSEGEVIAEKPDKGVVLFGVRPCDLEALKVMTKVFTTGKFSDPFFEAHLENTVIIGVGCKDKKPGCFCDMRETDMKYSSECDMFLEDKGDSYEVLYASEKGKEALKSYIPGLESFTNPEYKSPEFDKTLSIDASEEEMFSKINWDDVVKICQGCGMCTYICPTCHCFLFKDVTEGGDSCRYRNWDSCMFPKFTLHASGHNPRESKQERYRQRVMHKYLYVKKNFGHVACTGCGRCLRSCPAGMNIKTIVEGIMEELN